VARGSLDTVTIRARTFKVIVVIPVLRPLISSVLLHAKVESVKVGSWFALLWANRT
jgi:hypothetical protein